MQCKWDFVSCSLQFSHSVTSDSLQPHGLQYTRLPCPSTTPRACSNSCPLNQWCHQTISSSVVPFFSCLQFFTNIRVISSGSVLLIRWPTDKEFAFLCRRCRKAGLITGSGRSPGGGNGNPLQNSCLENSMDRGDWWAAIPRVTKNQTWLNDLACMHTLSMDQKLSKSSKSGASWASLIAKSNSQHASMMMKTNHTPSSVERV